MDNQNLEATAYHEAGHVAALLHFKHKPFDKVTIIPGDADEQGRAFAGAVLPIKGSEAEFYVEAVKEKYLKEQAIILMSGGEVQRIFLQEENRAVGCWGDDSDLASITLKLGIPLNAHDAFYNYISEETKYLFSDEQSDLWKFIHALVTELLKRKELSYDECLELYFKIIPEAEETYHICEYVTTDDEDAQAKENWQNIRRSKHEIIMNLLSGYDAVSLLDDLNCSQGSDKYDAPFRYRGYDELCEDLQNYMNELRSQRSNGLINEIFNNEGE